MESQNQPNNYQFFKTLAIGFTIVSFVIAIGVGGYILGTRNSRSLQDHVDEQNPVIFPTQGTVDVNKPLPSTLPNKSDETANWKTYINNAYNFEFKYPPTYEFESENPNSVTFSGTFGDNQKIPSELTLNFNPSIDSSILKKCGETTAIGEYKCLTDPTSEATINGIRFRKIHIMEGSGDAMGSAKYVVQTVDKPTLEFIHTVLGGGVENRMDKILSTFRFSR